MKISEYYNAFAELYETDRQSAIDIIGSEIKTFFKMILKPSILLDAGCGPGIEAKYASSLGHEVIGLDISDSMLERFKANVPSGRAMLGSLTNIPLHPNSVDHAYASFSLLHLNREEGVLAIQEIHRVTKPNGLFFICTSVSANESEHYTHRSARSLNLPGVYFFHWKEDELKTELKNAGFELLSWESKCLYEGRPNFLITILRKL